MSTRLAITVWVLAWLVFGAGGIQAAWEKAKATAEEIKKLVNDLGSANKGDVGRAKKRLAAIGPAALARLRQVIATNKGQPAAKAVRSVVVQIARQEQKKLEDQLARRKNKNAIVYPITDQSVGQTFPSHLILAVRFPLHPVAISPRAPLHSQNLFIVDKDGLLDQVTDFKGMEEFFRANTGTVTKASTARQVVRAWLAMSQELSQDGYYTFEKKVEREPTKFGLKATGEAKVKPEMGNKGAIKVTIMFDIDGMLGEVQERKQLKAGRRPKG
jgi:hypothetical protein